MKYLRLASEASGFASPCCGRVSRPAHASGSRAVRRPPPNRRPSEALVSTFSTASEGHRTNLETKPSMSRRVCLLATLLIGLLTPSSRAQEAEIAEAAPALHWEHLPALPDTDGLAGMYAGVSRGALLAAGGANFPDRDSSQSGRLKVQGYLRLRSSPER